MRGCLHQTREQVVGDDATWPPNAPTRIVLQRNVHKITQKPLSKWGSLTNQILQTTTWCVHIENQSPMHAHKLASKGLSQGYLSTKQSTYRGLKPSMMSTRKLSIQVMPTYLPSKSSLKVTCFSRKVQKRVWNPSMLSTCPQAYTCPHRRQQTILQGLS